MSTNPRIYLDFNATAPLGDHVRAAMTAAMAEAGNPSSIHAEGRRARSRVEQAREHVARAGRPAPGAGRVHQRRHRGQRARRPGARGGRRAARPAPRGGVRGHRPPVAARRGRRPRRARLAAPADRASPATARWRSTRSPASGLVALAAVNHELGTLADPGVVAAARAAGALVHVDAVQAAGKLPLADARRRRRRVSAHKLGGPQGAGALAIAHDAGLPAGRGRPPGARPPPRHRKHVGDHRVRRRRGGRRPGGLARGRARSATGWRPGSPRSAASASTAPVRPGSAARSTPGSPGPAASRSSSRSTSPGSPRRPAPPAPRARSSRRRSCSASAFAPDQAARGRAVQPRPHHHRRRGRRRARPAARDRRARPRPPRLTRIVSRFGAARRCPESEP